MLRLRHLLLITVFAIVLMGGVSSRAETIIDEWQSVKAPPPPQLKAVTLEPKTTALLLIDIIKQTCNMKMRPRCVAMVPKVAKLLAEARAKNVYVIYALFPTMASFSPRSWRRCVVSMLSSRWMEWQAITLTRTSLPRTL